MNRSRAALRDTLILWSACAAVLGCGIDVAVGLLGAATAVERELAARVDATIESNAALLGRETQLIADRQRSEEHVRGLDLHADRPTTLAAFITTADRIAARTGVTIVAIDEHPDASGVARTSAAAATLQPPATMRDVDPIPLEVRLTGPFRALVTTIRELARTAPVTMQIELADLERAAAATTGGGDPPLTARLHITLERLRDTSAPRLSRQQPPEELADHARSL